MLLRLQCIYDTGDKRLPCRKRTVTFDLCPTQTKHQTENAKRFEPNCTEAVTAWFSRGGGSCTWHLEGAAGVRAAGGVGEGGAAAAAARRGGVAVPGRVGERLDGVGLLLLLLLLLGGEGLGEGGVLGHVRLVLLQRVAEARQHGVLGVELAVPRHQHRGQH